jgi:hypothetical protein
MFKKKLKLMLLNIPGVPVKSSDAFISGAVTSHPHLKFNTLYFNRISDGL